MVECGGLENRYPRKGIIGSNPILSAMTYHLKIRNNKEVMTVLASNKVLKGSQGAIFSLKNDDTVAAQGWPPTVTQDRIRREHLFKNMTNVIFLSAGGRPGMKWRAPNPILSAMTYHLKIRNNKEVMTVLASNKVLKGSQGAIFSLKNDDTVAAQGWPPTATLAIAFSFLLIIFSTFLPFAHAEIIQLKNGKAIETRILKEDKTFVLVEVAGGQVKIPRADIQTIWRGSKEALFEVRGKKAHFAKGVELYNEGQFKEAAEQFRQALGPITVNAIIYANLGSAYASLGEAQKAEAHFLKALEQKPDDPDVLLNLAHFYETAKNFDKAISYYQKLTTLTPDNRSIQRNLAYCEYMAGNFLSSAKIFEALGQKNDVVARCNAAAAYIQANELDKAESILKTLLANPDPIPRAYFNIATLYRSRKNYAQAEEYYQKALLRDPQTIEIRLNLGQLYLEKTEWDKAEENFNQVLKKDPQNPAAIYGLAQTMAQKKDFIRAMSLLEPLFKNHPRDLSLLNEKGLLYLKMNEPKNALEVFHALLKIDDRYAKGHANAGLAYAFLGDVDNALKEWNRALELDPQLEAAAQNKKLLEDVMQGNKNETASVA